MHAEFIKIDLEKEVDRLVEMEAKIFSPSDRLLAKHFEGTECYWVVADGVIVGCTAFRHNYIVVKELGLISCEGGFYIMSTGIMPEFQGIGLGNKIKEWQISHAKAEGFVRITTMCRENNLRMINLNKKFGFAVSSLVFPNSYHDPEESGIIMYLDIA